MLLARFGTSRYAYVSDRARTKEQSGSEVREAVFSPAQSMRVGKQQQWNRMGWDGIVGVWWGLQLIGD
jgi:hypothetical protein